MSSEDNASSSSPQALAYTELNADNGKATILLINVGFVSGGQCDAVSQFLSQDYHLLLPDLPASGKSKDIQPFSKQLSAKLLAELIQKRALTGKAHVVGLSLGAHVAIELVSRSPDLVDAVFVSGFEVFSAPPPAVASVLWLQSRSTSLLPRPMLRWLTDDTDFHESDFSMNSFAYCRAIADAMCFGDDQCTDQWPQRT